MQSTAVDDTRLELFETVKVALEHLFEALHEAQCHQSALLKNNLWLTDVVAWFADGASRQAETALSAPPWRADNNRGTASAIRTLTTADFTQCRKSSVDLAEAARRCHVHMQVLVCGLTRALQEIGQLSIPKPCDSPPRDRPQAAENKTSPGGQLSGILSRVTPGSTRTENVVRHPPLPVPKQTNSVDEVDSMSMADTSTSEIPLAVGKQSALAMTGDFNPRQLSASHSPASLEVRLKSYLTTDVLRARGYGTSAAPGVPPAPSTHHIGPPPSAHHHDAPRVAAIDSSADEVSNATRSPTEDDFADKRTANVTPVFRPRPRPHGAGAKSPPNADSPLASPIHAAAAVPAVMPHPVVPAGGSSYPLVRERTLPFHSLDAPPAQPATAAVAQAVSMVQAPVRAKVSSVSATSRTPERGTVAAGEGDSPPALPAVVMADPTLQLLRRISQSTARRAQEAAEDMRVAEALLRQNRHETQSVAPSADQRDKAVENHHGIMMQSATPPKMTNTTSQATLLFDSATQTRSDDGQTTPLVRSNGDAVSTKSSPTSRQFQQAMNAAAIVEMSPRSHRQDASPPSSSDRDRDLQFDLHRASLARRLLGVEPVEPRGSPALSSRGALSHASLQHSVVADISTSPSTMDDYLHARARSLLSAHRAATSIV